MSVALATTFNSFSRRLLKVELSCREGLEYIPVPRETTHCRGVAGQMSFASWIANAQGLLVSRPPSLDVKKNKIKEEGERGRERNKIQKGLFSTEGGTLFT